MKKKRKAKRQKPETLVLNTSQVYIKEGEAYGAVNVTQELIEDSPEKLAQMFGWVRFLPLWITRTGPGVVTFIGVCPEFVAVEANAPLPAYMLQATENEAREITDVQVVAAQ